MEKFTIQGSDGQSYGPVDAQTLLSWARESRIAPDTKVFNEDLKICVEARTIPVLSQVWQGSIPTAPSTAFELKPLRLGELLDRTFRLYRSHFRSLFLISFVGQISMVILIDVLLGATGFFGAATGNAEAIKAALSTFRPAMLLVAIPGIMLVVALVSVMYMTIMAATTIAVSRAYLGQSFTMLECYKQGLSYFGKLLWTSILGYSVVLLGFLALIIPGIYLAISFILASVVVVLESLSGGAALRRSHELLRKKREKGMFKNNIWKLVVIGLVYFAIATPLAILGNFPSFIWGILEGISTVQGGKAADMPVWLTLFSQFTDTVAKSMVSPIATIAIILLYYDIRIRFEAFDLQMLAHAVSRKEDK